MIHSERAGPLRPRLRRPRRGPLPRGPLPGRRLGGGHPRRPERGRARLPLGDGGQRRRARRLDHPGPGEHRHRRGAPAPGRAARPVRHRRPVQQSRIALLPTFVDGRPNPTAIDLDEMMPAQLPGSPPPPHAVPQGAAGPAGLAARTYRPRRTEVVERLDEEDLLPAIYFVFSRAGCEDAVRLLPRRRPPPQLGRRAKARAGRSPSAHVEALSDDDLAVLGYGRFLAALEAGSRRPPCRHGAAVPGGGRGVLHRGAREGRLRHRDARPRDQHAGPLGRDRGAHEVRRLGPRGAHAGRVHPAHRAGRPARHRRGRLRRRPRVAVSHLRGGGEAGRRARPGAHVVVPPDLQPRRQPRPALRPDGGLPHRHVLVRPVPVRGGPRRAARCRPRPARATAATCAAGR